MQAGDAEREVAIGGIAETGGFHHAEEGFLIGKVADRFNEILIAVSVIGDRLSHAGDHVEGIKVIGLLHHRIRQLAELQDHKPPAGPQDAIGLVQRFLRARHVPDAKADGIDVEGIVGEGERHRVAHHPIEARRHIRRLGPLAPLDQHRFGQVEHGCMAAACSFEEAERNIARTARHIQKLLPRPRREPIHHRILPDAVNAKAHDIVHHIVFRGDRGENALHAAGLFLFPHRLKAEMRCSVRCVRHGLLP